MQDMHACDKVSKLNQSANIIVVLYRELVQAITTSQVGSFVEICSLQDCREKCKFRRVYILLFAPTSIGIVN